MEPKAALNCERLKKLVREVPDFPKPGILFYDITTLLKDNAGFATLIDALSEHYINHDIDLVLGIEARGFIFGPALAYRLNAGFVPIRKPRKLPATVARVRSEEHTSELQSRQYLVCRLLLEKKKKDKTHDDQCTYALSKH